ncbi:N-6 DNA methylase [Bacillus sp. LL01]|uniref:N-6 DNA methylase n=1 Tax=Bacillus sp. LL01 TaxID=1665556 RepID=UPI0009E5E5BD|nr:N-6 DNA methylase [Bacillus sp. LL01]
MGRHNKWIEKENRNVREIGYYSTPDFVAKYLSKRLLMINPNGEKVLDPCCGKEELLEAFFHRQLQVDGMDIESYKSEYCCSFHLQDFVRFHEKIQRDKANLQEQDYDYYIANPPYNCHEVDFISKNKTTLMKQFSDVGVLNMYSMFISALIDMAKEGALIGLITADSFFTAKGHEKLRRKIVETCAIHEITMCSNDLFHNQAADVRTSIVILQKGKKFQREVVTNNRPLSRTIFEKQLDKQLEMIRIEQHAGISLDELLMANPVDNMEFVIGCPPDIKGLFAGARIADEYKCVTGISTGRDELYLSKEKTGPYTVPFYKNPGRKRFYTENHLYLHKEFLTFDKEIKNFIVRNKPLLFQSGITCSSMGVEFAAARLPKNATYGVNANIICDEDDAWWLLAYLNSDLVTYMVRGVLIRSNMITSGYVSRIPLIAMEERDKTILGSLARKAHDLAQEGHPFEKELKEINQRVNHLSGISVESEEVIGRFKRNLIKST